MARQISGTLGQFDTVLTSAPELQEWLSTLPEQEKPVPPPEVVDPRALEWLSHLSAAQDWVVQYVQVDLVKALPGLIEALSNLELHSPEEFAAYFVVIYLVVVLPLHKKAITGQHERTSARGLSR